MRSVLENDKEHVDDGRLVQEAVNKGLGAFTPDMTFEKLVNNFKEAKELYGETILREITGESSSSLERNIRLPEYRKILREQLAKKLKELQDRNILDKGYQLTDKAFLLAAHVLVRDELEHLFAVGFGEHEHTEKRDEKGEDVTAAKRAYRDLDRRKTLAMVARRGHTTFERRDLRFREPQSTGKLSIMYCLDSSGSMKGTKLALAKRAGVALAYEAIRNGDDVGLLAFGASLETVLPPSKKFWDFVNALVTIRAKRETDIASAIRGALPVLTGKSKHIVLLTDGLHTAGATEEVHTAAQEAREQNVSVSIIGIALDKDGEALSREVVDIARGQFFHVQNIQELDILILEDYARLKRR